MNAFPKNYKKLDKKNNFNNSNNLYLSLQTSSSHRVYTKLNTNNINKKLFSEKNIISSNLRNKYKIRKFKSNLTLDTITSKNLSKKKNLSKESYIRTKSNDNKTNKMLETQKKSIMLSHIFENMNIKNHNIEKIDNKLKKSSELKLNTLIKVNIKKRKENNSISKNKTIGKNINLKPNTISKNKNIISNYKTESNCFYNNHKSICNLISQENFYNNKISKIIFIQKVWKKYLYFHKNFYNINERFDSIKRAKIKIFVFKLRKYIYTNVFKLLKNKLFNIKYYLHLWHNKTYLYKILQSIIYLRRSKFKKFQKNERIKKPNLSSRQIRSTFNRFKSLNINKINKTNLSITNNNLSYIENDSLNKKINNIIQYSTFSTISNINLLRKTNNKSSEKSYNKIPKNNIINKKNKPILKDLFKTTEINFSSSNTITPLKKVVKYANKFYDRNNFNKINDYSRQNKFNKNNNKTLRAILNRNLLLNKNNLSNNYINDEIKSISPITTNNNRNKKQYEIMTNMNTTNSINVFKDNRTVKNRFYKLKKFDTCPLSLIGKKSNKALIIKTKINKFFVHWKNITFKSKFVKYLINIKNKITIRQLFFRRIIRIILDFFQIIILKIYFDKYNNKTMKTGILLKLRAFLLKNNKFRKSIDLSNKENINYIEIKGLDVINNININNFVNYNNTNKIMPLLKQNNIWNNYTQVNNFRFPLTYINDEQINIINSKNNKIVKIKNSFPKGNLVAQINQLRMIFNLIDKHIQKKINTKNYFEIWKKNVRKNYKKIDISKKKGQSDVNKYIKINKNKICSTRDNIMHNKEEQNKVPNNITCRLIENINKKKIDNSSELSLVKKQINSEIIYTKKILNHKNQNYNNNHKFKNNFLKIYPTQRILNKIEEREVHFNYLATNKNNSLTKNIKNENINNKSDKLTESGIKNKISKIKIEFLENPMTKDKKGKNLNYNNIFENIKKSFTKKIVTIDYKIVNQTFCCPLVNYLDEI